MKVKRVIKSGIRHLGFEVSSYNIQTSRSALLQKILSFNKITTILDVGANCGQYASLVRECGYEGKIISFEPLSDAHSKLLRLSKSDSNWLIAPRMALGNEDSEVEINIAGNSQSSSILPMLSRHVESAPQSIYCGVEKVPIYKLDTLFSNYVKDGEQVFLKIDVQGFEHPVIQGARENLDNIAAIQLELSLVQLYKDEILIQEMADILDVLGFELWAILPAYTDTKTGRMLQVDGIFCKK